MWTGSVIQDRLWADTHDPSDWTSRCRSMGFHAHTSDVVSWVHGWQGQLRAGALKIALKSGQWHNFSSSWQQALVDFGCTRIPPFEPRLRESRRKNPHYRSKNFCTSEKNFCVQLVRQVRLSNSQTPKPNTRTSAIQHLDSKTGARQHTPPHIEALPLAIFLRTAKRTPRRRSPH